MTAAPFAVVGIDPGLTGALALFEPTTGELTVEDVPTFRVNGRGVVDHYGLGRIVVSTAVWTL